MSDLPEPKYPIPVERWDSHHRAEAMVCDNDCGYERMATAEEIAGGRVTSDVGPACPQCNVAPLVWKYEIGDKCPGCGKLGWWRSAYDDGSCSRVCHLQAEYAKEIAA